jgi:myo-inositol 2-dehydrogenase / D-chiro-inositol 1-dehydrogenase
MKICVIGCGGIAASSHGPALAHYASLHSDVYLAACCDVQPERARDFQAAFGFFNGYTNYEEMIAAEQPDVVCLFVPPHRTAELACDLLKRRIPLLLEKPPGLTQTEAEQIHTAAQETGTPHLVAFNRRFTPLVERFKTEFFTRFQPRDIQHIHYEMARVNRTDPDFSTTAIHGIDATAFLAGSAYRRVDFHYQPLPAYGETVANVYLDCLFESDATAHLAFLPVTGSLTERATIFAHDHAFYLELPLGTSGSDHPGRLLHLEKGKLVLEVSGPEAAGGSEGWWLNGFYGEDAAFFDAVRDGICPPSGIETTLQSVAIMEAMRERRSCWEG